MIVARLLEANLHTTGRLIGRSRYHRAYGNSVRACACACAAVIIGVIGAAGGWLLVTYARWSSTP